MSEERVVNLSELKDGGCTACAFFCFGYTLLPCTSPIFAGSGKFCCCRFQLQSECPIISCDSAEFYSSEHGICESALKVCCLFAESQFPPSFTDIGCVCCFVRCIGDGGSAREPDLQTGTAVPVAAAVEGGTAGGPIVCCPDCQSPCKNWEQCLTYRDIASRRDDQCGGCDCDYPCRLKSGYVKAKCPQCEESCADPSKCLAWKDDGDEQCDGCSCGVPCIKG